MLSTNLAMSSANPWLAAQDCFEQSELSASHDADGDEFEDEFLLCADRSEALARSFVASIPGMGGDEDARGLSLQRTSRMSTHATLPKATLRLAVQLDAAHVREARRAAVDALLVQVDALRGKQGVLLAALRDAAEAETARTGRAASPLIVPLLAERDETSIDASDDALDAALVARVQQLRVARSRLGKWAEKRDGVEGGMSRPCSHASLSRDIVERSTSAHRLPRPRTPPRDAPATDAAVSPRTMRANGISQRTQSRIDMHKRLHRTKSMLRISRIEERIGEVGAFRSPPPPVFQRTASDSLSLLRGETLSLVSSSASSASAFARTNRPALLTLVLYVRACIVVPRLHQSELDVQSALLMLRMQHTLRAVAETAERVEALERAEQRRAKEQTPSQADAHSTATERRAEIERLRALVETQRRDIDALRRCGGTDADDAGAAAAEGVEAAGVEMAGAATAGAEAAGVERAAAATVPRKLKARPSRSALRATEWAAGFVDGRYRGNTAPLLSPFVFGAAPPEPPQYTKP